MESTYNSGTFGRNTVITFSRAVALLAAIVNDFGADYLPGTPDGESGCIYVKEAKPYGRLDPVCLIGQAFAYLGILRALLSDDGCDQYQACNVGEPMWSNAERMGVTFTPEAQHFMRLAQANQDASEAWGLAVSKAIQSVKEQVQSDALANHGFDLEVEQALERLS